MAGRGGCSSQSGSKGCCQIDLTNLLRPQGGLDEEASCGIHTPEDSSSVDVWRPLDFALLVVVARGLAILGYVQDVADEVVVVMGK